MSATHSLLRAALVFGTTAALAAGALAGTALADPPAATFPTLAGVGSDTIQDWGHGFATDSAGLIGSYDATPAGTYILTRNASGTTETFPTIVTGGSGNVTLPAGSILRPDGSGAGVSALRASLGDPSLTSGNWITQVGARDSFKEIPPGSIDFARSSSGPSAPNANGDLVYIPFAKDAVTWSKKAGDTSLPANFLKTQLVSLYSCTAVTISGVTYDPNFTGTPTATLKPVRPLVPQAGSGTRTFWGAQLNFPVGAGLLPACVKDVDSTGVAVQEHNGSALRNNGDIMPFSIPSWIAQNNSASLPGVIDRRNGATLQSIDAVAPTTAGALTSDFPIKRDMYVVTDWITVQDPTTNLYKAFNLESGSSQLCNSTRITQYGFGTVSYCGDILTTNRAFDFRPDPTNTATTLAASPAGAQTAGSAVTFTATVAPAAAGTVTFKDGSTTLGSAPVVAGSAAFTTSTLAVGSHSITANFAPTSSILFTASASAVATYTISTLPAVATTTTLAISPVGPQVKGTPVTFSAVVTGAGAAGSVVFKNGATTIGSAPVAAGQATFTSAVLAGGVYSVTANFVPTDAALFTPSSSAAAAYTISTPTTATLKLTKSSTAYGSAAAATVTIAGSGIVPAGKVTVKEGTTTVATGMLLGGKVTIGLPKTLSVGTHKLVASFAGSNIVGASASAAATLTVTKAAGAVKVSLSKTSVAYNSTTVKAVVTVSGGGVVPSGTITLKDGSKTVKSAVKLAGGKATVTLPKNVAVGTHKYQASYSGNTVVAAAKSATATLTVKKVTPSVKAKLAASKINKAAKGKVTVTVKATGVVPTGKVTVKERGRSLASVSLTTARKGVATIVLPKLAVGSHKITVSYAGSTTVAAKAASAVTLTVTK